MQYERADDKQSSVEKPRQARYETRAAELRINTPACHAATEAPMATTTNLRIKERRNATATALADKGELLGGGNPDLGPLDVESVAARTAMRRREDGGEAPTRGIVAGRPRSDPQERTWFFCGKAGHMIRDCKRMQKAKGLERRDRAPRRRSPDISSRQSEGNAKAPTRRAAQ